MIININDDEASPDINDVRNIESYDEVLVFSMYVR